MAAFLKKIKRKQRSYEANLVNILKTALFFEGTKKWPENVEIKFVWDYGLPRDFLTEAQTHQILVESGIESIETAIQELKDLDGEALTRELEKIKKQLVDEKKTPNIEL